jgi:hypothetical protein
MLPQISTPGNEEKPLNNKNQTLISLLLLLLLLIFQSPTKKNDEIPFKLPPFMAL